MSEPCVDCGRVGVWCWKAVKDGKPICAKCNAKYKAKKPKKRRRSVVYDLWGE